VKLSRPISILFTALPLGIMFAAINPVVASASTAPAFGLTFFDQGSVCQVHAVGLDEVAPYQFSLGLST
jgi:hypothetical protein